MISAELPGLGEKDVQVEIANGTSAVMTMSPR